MPLRLSPLSVTPSNPPGGGARGGLRLERSDPPQHATASRATRGVREKSQRQKAAGEPEKDGGSIGSERRAKPPTHSSRGDFFFKKACCPRQGRGLCAGSTGESTPAEHSGADRASVFRGCGRGAYRYMAMSQYSVLCGCICSLSTAKALA